MELIFYQSLCIIMAFKKASSILSQYLTNRIYQRVDLVDGIQKAKLYLEWMGENSEAYVKGDVKLSDNPYDHEYLYVLVTEYDNVSYKDYGDKDIILKKKCERLTELKQKRADLKEMRKKGC